MHVMHELIEPRPPRDWILSERIDRASKEELWIWRWRGRDHCQVAFPS